MGKKKGGKKKQTKNSNQQNRGRQVEQFIDDDDECGSIRSDAATLRSSEGTTIVTPPAECDNSMEGGSVRHDPPLPGGRTHRRKRVTWEELESWWQGECSDFHRITNDLIYDMNRERSEAIMTAFQLLQIQDDSSLNQLLKDMAENAAKYGVRGVPEVPPRTSTFLQKKHSQVVLRYSKAEIREAVYKWQLTQMSYLPSGKFDDLRVGRWASWDSQRPVLSTSQDSKADMDFLADISLTRQMDTLEMSEQDSSMAVEEGSRSPQDDDSMPDIQGVSANASNTNARTNPEYVKVQLFTTDGIMTVVSIRRTTLMGKLKEKHSRRLERPLRSLVYRFKGKNIKDNETVADLGLRDDDIIHVGEALPIGRRH